MLTSFKQEVLRRLANIKIKINMRKTSQLNTETANERLKSFYSKEYPSFVQKNVIEDKFDLQIIIPAYNVEEYIVECIESILAQKTDYSFKVVIINDGSNDKTNILLNEYADIPFIEITSIENSGVSKARNIALKNIKGKYTMFMDSDDKLADNAIQVLLKAAFNYDADIVEGGHQLFKDGYNLDCTTHGSKVFACDRFEFHGFPWGKVIRSDCLKDFCFPEGYLFEDTVMTTLLYPGCDNMYCIPDIVYMYRDNTFGITRTSIENTRCIDTYWIMKYCLEERLKRGQCLEIRDIERYLYACYRNWGRTKNMPMEIQECIFVLTCELIEKSFQQQFFNYSGKYELLCEILKHRSFEAFIVLMNNWWLIMVGM